LNGGAKGKSGRIDGKMNKAVIDADGLVLGRMASIVAKRLLNGEFIDLVNAEKAVVSGKRAMVIKSEKKFLEVGGRGRGPTHWRQPHRIVRRTIRGMLPYRKARGREAFKRLKVHIGLPGEFDSAEKETFPEIHSNNLGRNFVTIGEIAVNIGWKKI
jgi:large subunit ribosomal protein L13